MNKGVTLVIIILSSSIRSMVTAHIPQIQSPQFSFPSAPPHTWHRCFLWWELNVWMLMTSSNQHPVRWTTVTMLDNPFPRLIAFITSCSACWHLYIKSKEQRRLVTGASIQDLVKYAVYLPRKRHSCVKPFTLCMAVFWRICLVDHFKSFHKLYLH